MKFYSERKRIILASFWTILALKICRLISQFWTPSKVHSYSVELRLPAAVTPKQGRLATSPLSNLLFLRDIYTAHRMPRIKNRSGSFQVGEYMVTRAEPRAWREPGTSPSVPTRSPALMLRVSCSACSFSACSQAHLSTEAPLSGKGTASSRPAEQWTPETCADNAEAHEASRPTRKRELPFPAAPAEGAGPRRCGADSALWVPANSSGGDSEALRPALHAAAAGDVRPPELPQLLQMRYLCGRSIAEWFKKKKKIAFTWWVFIHTRRWRPRLLRILRLPKWSGKGDAGSAWCSPTDLNSMKQWSPELPRLRRKN